MKLRTLNKMEEFNTMVIACASLEASETIKTFEKGN